MVQTGHLIPLIIGILLLTIGLTFFFVAKEAHPDIKG
jgi:hypothetical protein